MLAACVNDEDLLRVQTPLTILNDFPPFNRVNKKWEQIPLPGVAGVEVRNFLMCLHILRSAHSQRKPPRCALAAQLTTASLQDSAYVPSKVSEPANSASQLVSPFLTAHIQLFLSRRVWVSLLPARKTSERSMTNKRRSYQTFLE